MDGSARYAILKRLKRIASTPEAVLEQCGYPAFIAHLPREPSSSRPRKRARMSPEREPIASTDDLLTPSELETASEDPVGRRTRPKTASSDEARQADSVLADEKASEAEHLARIESQDPWNDDKPDNPWGFPERIVQEHPALRLRNFFVLQQHHATAKHFDLRLQSQYIRDGVGPCTLSFALPKGFEGFRPDKPAPVRMAVETHLHPIDYTTYEGVSVGTTIVCDIGSYTMRSSYAALRRGEDQDADTQDEIGRPGSADEEALAQQYRNRSITVELKGRHHHFIVNLKLSDNNTKYTKPKGSKPGVTEVKRSWLLQVRHPRKHRNVPFRSPYAVWPSNSDDFTSLFTGKTIAQVKAEYEASLLRSTLKEKEDRARKVERDRALKPLTRQLLH
ncbi:uncharacterized protein L969DRAFT_93761 [Mixia osmundae IAM 14324]|uniref:DNA ligase D 3'-phosphoesterase domain-containing protein n=1 Tax=Mixia osmundae (strain CBS 9802 / IAM 14324 / JCM 22182 / KY 12970) TaxID=764103 RepID=G7E9H9_MIXOS|nr:uncharacterized protein L969DRAFT_93761 [Mixia osmundae IAM 14324]KEI39930.1 hypothetical protein L969DRAFT_93761 [Mixia osmundae IAM 14324]GAA99298.1 hypothetical protein E5Q_05993 [Mixia osmundae IAM 14324]